MASDEPSEQPLRTSPSANGSASGSNAATARPPRREASTVVIACRQCRSRKIRCDSTRPVCNNCSRRSNECVYDAVPKRRGPDKRPGTRQRSCKKRPSETEPSGTQAKKRRKIEDDDSDGNLIAFDPKGRATSEGRGSLLSPNSSAADDIAGFHMPQAPPLVLETSIPNHTIVSEVIYPKQVEQPLLHRSPPYDTLDLTLHRPYPRLVGSNMHRDDETPSIPLSPSTVYERQTWWDTLLNTYERTPQLSVEAIFSDLEFLISTSNYWLFFFNPPALFGSIRDAHQRQSIQPSLILSALAMANLMKSSEIECGVQGRNRAVALRDRAQASLEAACSSQAVDYTLAEAALVLALFESSSHPEHSTQRATESLRFVDRIISALSLSRIDEGDPDVCVFHPDNIPIVFTPGYDLPTTCACVAAPHSPSSEESPIHSRSHFSYNPPWESSWTPDEHRKEECRRVCWCALNLVSSYTAQCAAFHDEPLDLRLSDPANYAILFPGEAYERMSNHRIPGQSPKHSIWALYCRSMLLWNSCVRYSDTSATWTTDKRASFAIDAWRETRAIEDALDIHQCNLDTSLIYICREYIYNTRMSTTYEFRRLQDIDNVSVPMFTRRNAQEWLYYQDGVARGVQESVKNIGEESGHLLSRRPFQALWFSSQVSMCLALWSYDRGLLQALELAKTFFVPLDALNVLWPCPALLNLKHVSYTLLPCSELCAPATNAPALSTDMQTIGAVTVPFSLSHRPVVAKAPPDDTLSREEGLSHSLRATRTARRCQAE
ncbi:hypothetical protein PHLCEN_2v147 [Hermanssonia centrifuga]|uniref:Zn(2)-C6 fungal-type domain-containing protein n=1 Tax=Hermanssonia centrifuga TaxID=98765 RepID=A0A2R6S6V0_9APHY|nr:hypothetical protein PHLCEN_2v147 [Hermanssonia centrifuga]